jgi:hypothetical protein
MIEVKPTEQGVKAVDIGKNSITVGTESWLSTDSAAALGHPVDEVLSGEATRLSFPQMYAKVHHWDGDLVVEPNENPEPVDLDEGDYLLSVDGNVKAYVRFAGPATVDIPSYDEIALSFPSPTQVTIGFRSRIRSPRHTVTVPPTPEGAATALTYLSSAFETDSPDRTFPSMRGHPPRLAVGEEVSIPAAVRRGHEENGVRFRVPPSFDSIYPVAPLAHYLSATVTVEDRAAPLLETDALRHEFSEPPALAGEVATMLRRVFYLDCLARTSGPHESELAELNALDGVDLDLDRLYGAGVATRLEAYLDTATPDLEAAIPKWHLAMYVEPTGESLTQLPFLLHNLAAIYPAESEPLEQEERLSLSLDDFYRGRGQVSGPPPVDIIKPKLRDARMHGWLADGAPIDVFKSIAAAYENRFDYFERSGDSISVVAVLNDSEMADEHVDAAEIYRKRSEGLDIDISVRERLTTDELAAVFEAEHDFVHYIGHCEADGLRCSDGNLSVTSLTESNTQVFFLNACGSFHEGIELIEKGSVAGAVTFNKVLDSQAARVGTAFARLLVHGFSIDHAMQLARRRIMMGKDYTVVGDGTHTLAQADFVTPSNAVLEDRGDDGFTLEYDVFSPALFGSSYQHSGLLDSGRLFEDQRRTLLGNPTRLELTGDELDEFLGHTNTAVVYDGDIHWSSELRERLGDDSS